MPFGGSHVGTVNKCESNINVGARLISIVSGSQSAWPLPQNRSFIYHCLAMHHLLICTGLV